MTCESTALRAMADLVIGHYGKTAVYSQFTQPAPRSSRFLSTPAKIAYLPTEGAPMVPYPVGAPSIEKTALFSRSRPVKARRKTHQFLKGDYFYET